MVCHCYRLENKRRYSCLSHWHPGWIGERAGLCCRWIYCGPLGELGCLPRRWPVLRSCSADHVCFSVTTLCLYFRRAGLFFRAWFGQCCFFFSYSLCHWQKKCIDEICVTLIPWQSARGVYDYFRRLGT